MEWRSFYHQGEQWLGRFHLLCWLVPPSVIGAVTAIMGYIESAPFYMLIPATLAAIAFASFIVGKLQYYIKPTPKSSPTIIMDFATAIDFKDNHTKFGFSLRKNASRLRVRLDQSNFVEGAIGAGNVWASPIRSLIYDVKDIVSGVRQIVPLTEIGERDANPGQPKHQFIKWANTDTPISPSGLYRGRIVFIADDAPEEAYTFFAVSCPKPEIGRSVVRIIGQEQFHFLSSWDEGIIQRHFLQGSAV